MIRELADFEKALDRVEATESTLSSTLSFAPCSSDPHPDNSNGYAKTFLILDPATKRVAGMALYFNNYSTWLSCPGIYLEDLFIRPDFRRRGYAKRLLRRLGEEAAKISGGKGRLEWSCLRWNQNALDTYKAMGASTQDEWIGLRVEGEGLTKMGDKVGV